jgi:hypothetical protein
MLLLLLHHLHLQQLYYDWNVFNEKLILAGLPYRIAVLSGYPLFLSYFRMPPSTTVLFSLYGTETNTEYLLFLGRDDSLVSRGYSVRTCSDVECLPAAVDYLKGMGNGVRSFHCLLFFCVGRRVHINRWLVRGRCAMRRRALSKCGVRA